MPLVMITAYGSIENAVEAMKKGRAGLHHEAIQQGRHPPRGAQAS